MMTQIAAESFERAREALPMFSVREPEGCTHPVLLTRAGVCLVCGTDVWALYRAKGQVH